MEDVNNALTQIHCTQSQSTNAPNSRKRTPKWMALAAQKTLYEFCERIWLANLPAGTPRDLPGIGPDAYLSHREIQKISMSVASIQHPQNICAHLKTKTHFHLAPIAPYVQELVDTCKKIVLDTLPPPRGPCAPRVPRDSSVAPARSRQSSVAPARSRQSSVVPARSRQSSVATQAESGDHGEPGRMNDAQLMPPPPNTPKPKTYDPAKRHEYYVRSRDRKRAALQELQNESTPGAIDPTTPQASPRTRKRANNGQENTPPNKAPRTN